MVILDVWQRSMVILDVWQRSINSYMCSFAWEISILVHTTWRTSNITQITMDSIAITISPTSVSTLKAETKVQSNLLCLTRSQRTCLAVARTAV